MDAAALVAKVKTEGSFAVDDITALGWINEVYADAVARSGWIERVVSLGNTVNGQSQYAISDTYVDVRAVKIANNRYTVRATVQEMWDLQSGYTSFAGKAQDGVFSEGFDATDVRYVEVFPTPVTNGLAIKAFVSVLPTDLVLGPPPTTPILPVDMHPMLVNGAVAIGLSRWSEREDEAEPKRAMFEAGVKELQTRANARVGGAPADRERIYAADFVSRVKAEGKFDAVDSTVLAWINEAYTDLVARSEWNVNTVSAGNTAGGTALYTVPGTISSVRSVNVGTQRYATKITQQELEDLRSGYATMTFDTGDSGVFVEKFDATGAAKIELYPTPGTVQAITVQAVVLPAPLTLTATAMPAIPADMYGTVIAGAIGIGQQRYVGNPELAQGNLAAFEAGVEQLAARAKRRDMPHERKVAYGDTDLVGRVKTEGNFDAADSTVLGWVNEAYRDLVARSGWIERVVDIGPTVAGLAQYVLSDSYVSVKAVRVGSPSLVPGQLRRHTRAVTLREIWDLQSGYAQFSGTLEDGVFAEGFGSGDTRYVTLYPIPTGNGYPVEAFVTALPTALTLTAQTPVIPVDLQSAVIAGAVAIGLSRWKAQPDAAQEPQARFDAGVAELRKRAEARVGGAPAARNVIYGSDLTAKVKAEGNFDVEDSTVLGWVNEAYRDAVARSGWLREQINIGPTVAGQGRYALDETVVELQSLNVAGSRFDLVLNATEMWDLASGDMSLIQRVPSGGGAFAAGYDAAGARYVDIWPVPEQSGLAITGLATLVPVALTLNPVTNPSLPADISTPMLVAGATAIGRARWDQKPDLAAPQTQIFEAKVEELRRRANARVGGSRAHRMPIAGYDF